MRATRRSRETTMSRRILWTISLLAAALTAQPPVSRAATVGSRDAAVRRQFLAAMDRVEFGAPDTPDPPALVHYPLYEYLVAARLQRDLAAAPGRTTDARVASFLDAHAHEPVTYTLRRDWLLSLAARGRWGTFLPLAASSADPRVACDRLAGRIASGKDPEDLPAQAIARWLEPRAQPAECDPVFAWLQRRGDLTEDLRELRVRGALDAGNPQLALQFAARLPAARAAPLRLWARLLESPQPTLESIAADPHRAAPAAAIAAGFDLLSRRDGRAAMSLLPRLLDRPGLPPALRPRLQLSAALGAAYDRDADALAAFARVPPTDIDAMAGEWRVRAALWNGDFAQALAAIDALPPAVAAEPRWQYWRARAVAATAGAAAARPLYAKIAQRRDFYGYLAADRLRRPYRLHARLTPIDRRILGRLAADPGLIRARELYFCGMVERATLEWRYALRDADAATFVQAARLAAAWGWYERSIIALKQADDWDDLRLRYPRPYRRAVVAASRMARVPPDWLFAVMRQESLYQPDALSPADARGLMQLQPRTAVAIARRWHLRRPTPAQLMSPPVALDLGAAYLRDLLDRFDGQLALGLAAYNAGPAAVERWLPDQPMPADVWIENIPYRETRAYVQHIVEHIVAFAWTRGAPPPRLARLLREVRPPPSFAARRRANSRSFQ